MATLTAIVQLQGKEYEVISSRFDFSRKTDSNGKPVTGVVGGRLTITIETTKDTTITEAMLNCYYKPISGKLNFYDTTTESLIRVVEFRCAYLVHYKETFVSDRKKPMMTTFTLSAKTLLIGDALLNKEWK